MGAFFIPTDFSNLHRFLILKLNIFNHPCKSEKSVENKINRKNY